MRRLFSLFALLIFPLLAVAVPARAAGDPPDSPFVVKDVKVDASAASAAEAFTIAVDEGRQKAWKKLIHRLTREEDWPRVPAIDTATLKRMTSGYQVSDEKRSTTRYVASVTYTFNGDLVRRFLQGANIAYADTAAPPLLVIPMNPGYAPGSDWAAAWTGHRMAAGAVPLELPAPDALNRSILAPLDFDSATWSDIQPAASRARARQVALVEPGAISGGQMTVRIRFLSPAGSHALGPIVVPVSAGTAAPAAYAAAMQAAANAIGNTWKARSAIDFNRHATLTAEIHLDSLAQWGRIQQRLANVPVVTNVNVEAMNIGQARIVIGYAGTPAQLNDFLAQASFALSNRDGVWWLGTEPAQGGRERP